MHKIETLYKQYKQDVYRYLLSLTREPTLSEDMLSETFLKAIRGLPGFQGRSSIKTWLFVIARNVWLQHLRSVKPQLEHSDLMQIYMTNSLEEHYITQEAAERIVALLDSRDDRTRTIVLMRVDGYAFAEISNALGISESSARVIDHRAKNWIKSTLEKEGLR
ncbi:RNA polymerase sigma factor [Paenibacillus sp. NPDC058071]|uniref:RNA polymerase sigma factor n=1 Tax=Paenibacillus sp. NPDC058071 TaxID=3346326 RepID=UPI0036DDBBF3